MGVIPAAGLGVVVAYGVVQPCGRLRGGSWPVGAYCAADVWVGPQVSHGGEITGAQVADIQPRFAREEASPAAWSSAEMPSGTSSATMSTRVPASTAVTCQVIVMVPA